MDSATKTVGGVDIAWMALTFNVARILMVSSLGVSDLKKCPYRLLTTYRWEGIYRERACDLEGRLAGQMIILLLG